MVCRLVLKMPSRAVYGPALEGPYMGTTEEGGSRADVRD